MPLFSIIIPVYKEQTNINHFLNILLQQTKNIDAEIIVVDGKKKNNTIEKIKFAKIKKIATYRGRGQQMNAGAKIASGKILTFLHSDTILPNNAFSLIEQHLKNNKFYAVAFSLQIQSKHWYFKYVASSDNLRSRITRIPFGDHTISLKKSFFDSIEGYKNIPILEDVELMKRLRKQKKPIIILKEKVITSARRWEKEGFIFGSWRNTLLQFLYFIGISPKKLVKFYT